MFITAAMHAGPVRPLLMPRFACRALPEQTLVRAVNTGRRPEGAKLPQAGSITDAVCVASKM